MSLRLKSRRYRYAFECSFVVLVRASPGDVLELAHVPVDERRRLILVYFVVLVRVVPSLLKGRLDLVRMRTRTVLFLQLLHSDSNRFILLEFCCKGPVPDLFEVDCLVLPQSREFLGSGRGFLREVDPRQS